MTTPASFAADPVLLHAAGSLRFALSEVIAAYEVGRRRNGTGRPLAHPVRSRIAIAKGERAEVFASANMEHPQALADAARKVVQWCCSCATSYARWSSPDLR